MRERTSSPGLPVLLPLLLLACASPPADASGPSAAAAPAPEAPAPAPPAGPATVASAYPPPAGAERVPAGAFGQWLQALPLRAADAPVRTHDGQVVPGHRAHVLEFPIVKGDLQQCADAILRARAEWLRATGGKISFHATSGDPLPWSRYAAGERPYAPGNSIKWKPGSDKTWEGYLSAVFTWAGTASLQSYETVSADAPQPGDVLVEGGFPGHAVLLVDVARRGDETFILIAESYMPAQDFHLELGPEGGWWRWAPEMDLRTWGFDPGDLRRWKE